ncbi:MAG: hypothetical protein LBG87_06690 [Spirochaetaceae bacterium]|jgi:hypothetical protein|nr:hypothetical protein [Spirochaetaceae bacterium]
MSAKEDWLPASRLLMLEMADIWEERLVSDGERWGVPRTVIDEFTDASAKAKINLINALSLDRTSGETTRLCKAAFSELEQQMRRIKDRWFQASLLSSSVIEELGLLPQASGYGAIAERPQLTITPLERLRVQIRAAPPPAIRYDPCGLVRIEYRWGILCSGGDRALGNRKSRYMAESPEKPEDLPESFSEKRRACEMTFSREDSGGILCICACYAGEVFGPWSEQARAVIP